jgi:hypothetical protein
MMMSLKRFAQLPWAALATVWDGPYPRHLGVYVSVGTLSASATKRVAKAGSHPIIGA